MKITEIGDLFRYECVKDIGINYSMNKKTLNLEWERFVVSSIDVFVFKKIPHFSNFLFVYKKIFQNLYVNFILSFVMGR